MTLLKPKKLMPLLPSTGDHTALHSCCCPGQFHALRLLMKHDTGSVTSEMAGMTFLV